MNILGHTGLVHINNRPTWEFVRAALISHGYKPMSGRGNSDYLKDRNGKIVTDIERLVGGGAPVGWYVELEALKQAGIEP